MDIKVAKITNKGGRNYNEDYCDFYKSEDRCLLVLADGLGGHGGGDVASKVAVEKTIELLKDCKINKSEDFEKILKGTQNEVINVQKQQRKLSTVRTTLVTAVVEEEQLFIAHIGDSRAYVFRNNELLFQTNDHSVVWVLMKTGEISEEEIRNHPDRNKVLRVVGVEGSFRPEIQKEGIKLESGDAILLCTDGFWEYVLEEEMIKLLKRTKNPNRWLKLMEKRINKRVDEGNDNYSAIAAYI